MKNLAGRIAGFSLKKNDHLTPKSVIKEEEIVQSQGRVGSSFPLSFGQQRLWYMDQLVPDSFVYNIPVAIRLTGKLDVDTLEQCLNEIIRRHETLRTSFKVEEAQPVQIVTPVLQVALSRTDLQTLSKTEQEARVQHLAVQEMKHAFDLSQSPLLRVNLLQLDKEEYVLLMIMHRIIWDSWSLRVFIQELVILYQSVSTQNAPLLPDLAIQYADFAVQQRQWLQTEEAETQLAYWKKQLAGTAQALQLPTDRPRPAVQSFRGASYTFQLTRVLTEELKTLSQREGITLLMTLLAAVNTLLFRYTQQDDMIVGTPVANRMRTELEGLIGFFTNTLVLRTDLSGDPRFVEVLGRIRAVASKARAHQDLPYELLVEELRPERDLSYNPLFQVMVGMEDVPMEILDVPDLTVIPLQVESKTTPFDIAFEFSEMPDGLSGRLVYSIDLFDATTIARLAGHLQTLLEGIVAHPEQRIGVLPILTEAEQQRLLVAWNETANTDPTDRCLHQLFETQVERSPDAVAVVFEDERVTYRELNVRANQLAHYLQKLGVGPEVMVGICVERSLEMVVGLLGILKAGGAYVPLDPAYPSERLAFILADTQSPVLLTQQQLIAQLPENAGYVVRLDTDWEKIARESEENLDSGVKAENLAYVIYTSGSTGKPKGVLVTHANVVRLFESTFDWYHFDNRDIWTFFHSYAFDFSVWELWGALLYGGRVVVVSYWVSRTPEAFYNLLCAEQVTVLNQTPSAFYQLIQAEKPSAQDLALRLVIFGGEALEFQKLRPWFDRHGDQTPRLVNMYGITETTVHVTYYPLSAADLDATSGSVIGCPIPDLQVYILDQHQQLVPIGVPGEMYVGGAGLARGYLNRPELTTERFILHSLGKESVQRLYKTGDLARYRADGSIEFLGRIDNQVKIRGFRIELGEIEAALSQNPVVRECVVVAREDKAGDKRLVSYVVAREESAPPVSDLRRSLKEQLPDYMVPSAFVLLKAFPLTPNGKLDRKALPLPNTTDVVRDGAIAAPTTPTEKRLVDIVAPLLGLEQVGIDDNFFLIGGNSLMGVQLVMQVVDVFGIDFLLRTLFDTPTVRQLAAGIERLMLVKLQAMSDDEARYLLEEVYGTL
jgi:amino acid adenylation domain-containing protein